MNQTKLPEEWDDEKVQRVLAHYEGQTDEEALAEDEAALESTDAIVTVPHDLLPQARERIG